MSSVTVASAAVILALLPGCGGVEPTSQDPAGGPAERAHGFWVNGAEQKPTMRNSAGASLSGDAPSPPARTRCGVPNSQTTQPHGQSSPGPCNHLAAPESADQEHGGTTPEDDPIPIVYPPQEE